MTPTRVQEIDWSLWRAQMRATEVLVVRGDQILLIRKKRGLGAGKINGPGGRLEPGETLLDCAIREVEEELCVTPQGLRWMCDHRVQFTDGLALHLDVYRADDVSGTPSETAEAVPHWFPTHGIPYDEMWADTRLWIPRLLSGERCTGRYVFEGDHMLDHTLTPCTRDTPLPL